MNEIKKLLLDFIFGNLPASIVRQGRGVAMTEAGEEPLSVVDGVSGAGRCQKYFQGEGIFEC